MFAMSDNRKIGTLLLLLGVLFLGLGVVLFFDRALLMMGNVLFLAGFTFLSGLTSTLSFFRSKPLRAHVPFWFGLLLVLWGWSFFGFCLQLFGIVSLFANFIPLVLVYLRALPYVGNVLKAPGVAPIVDRLAGLSRRPAV
eukprot:PLAT1275.1.p2 GENE.PLAT1275.1~~PLAT1275.1.p2  ORF type:complete len:140 (-),score=52.15 PLAT1275.1:447-866(-)